MITPDTKISIGLVVYALFWSAFGVWVCEKDLVSFCVMFVAVCSSVALLLIPEKIR